jgi:hypothetical protein
MCQSSVKKSGSNRKLVFISISMVAFLECVPRAKSPVSNTLSTHSESLHSNQEKHTKRGGTSLFLGARRSQLVPNTAEPSAREVRSGQKRRWSGRVRGGEALTALLFGGPRRSAAPSLWPHPSPSRSKSTPRQAAPVSPAPTCLLPPLPVWVLL